MIKKLYALWPCMHYPFWMTAPVIGFTNNGRANVRIGKKIGSIRASKLIPEKEGRKLLKRLQQLKVERASAVQALEKTYESKLNRLQAKYF